MASRLELFRDTPIKSKKSGCPAKFETLGHSNYNVLFVILSILSRQYYPYRSHIKIIVLNFCNLMTAVLVEFYFRLYVHSLQVSQSLCLLNQGESL